MFTAGGVDGNKIEFMADLSQVPGTNGVLNLGVPTPPYTDEIADYITFTAPGLQDGENHEYALAGLDIQTLASIFICDIDRKSVV